MVVFYLRNSRNPDAKVVPVTVSLSLDAVRATQSDTRVDQDPTATGVNIGLPNLADPEGNRIWILIAQTTERDISGNKIPPEIVNLVSTGTVHLEIEAALGRIGSQIDWGTIQADTSPPKLIDITPALTQTTNVPITSNIVFRLQEPLPAAGIDLSTLSVKLNDFDITGDVELRGNIFDLTVIYRPTRILS
jgi:hypothetical protein